MVSGLCRVIALAWKKLDAELTPSQITALSREEIECGLTFGGFAVFHCPLKEDSEPALRMLKVGLIPALHGARPVSRFSCLEGMPALKLPQELIDSADSSQHKLLNGSCCEGCCEDILSPIWDHLQL